MGGNLMMLQGVQLSNGKHCSMGTSRSCVQDHAGCLAQHSDGGQQGRGLSSQLVLGHAGAAPGHLVEVRCQLLVVRVVLLDVVGALIHDASAARVSDADVHPGLAEGLQEAGGLQAVEGLQAAEGLVVHVVLLLGIVDTLVHDASAAQVSDADVHLGLAEGLQAAGGLQVAEHLQVGKQLPVAEQFQTAEGLQDDGPGDALVAVTSD